MRLIDADALIECIKDEMYNRADYWYNLIANALIECIYKQDTIEIPSKEKLKNDIECIVTVEDNLRMVDDEMTLCMMRIDDIQRAIIQMIADLETLL